MRILLGLAALVLAGSRAWGSRRPSTGTGRHRGSGGRPGDPERPGDWRLRALYLAKPVRPGRRVVFRAKVFDAHSGQEVRDGTATVMLDTGITVRMRYDNHPPPNIGPSTDQYWVGVWPSAPMRRWHRPLYDPSGGRRPHWRFCPLTT